MPLVTINSRFVPAGRSYCQQRESSSILEDVPAKEAEGAACAAAAPPIPGIEGLPGIEGMLGLPGIEGIERSAGPATPPKEGILGLLGMLGVLGIEGIEGPATPPKEGMLGPEGIEGIEGLPPIVGIEGEARPPVIPVSPNIPPAAPVFCAGADEWIITLEGLPYFCKIFVALSPSFKPARVFSFVLRILNALPDVTSEPDRIEAGTLVDDVVFFDAEMPGTAAVMQNIAINKNNAALLNLDVILTSPY